MTREEKKAIKAAKFAELKKDVNKNYKLNSKIYFKTIDGVELAEVVEHNESSYLGYISVKISLKNGRFQSLMFTI